ncbi:FecR family protein [Thalassobellus sediminis]|uniref:FecR family protein n=1 Tax=Thalassobellus sediminis TaxID=3367753 RepID=UPI003796BD57
MITPKTENLIVKFISNQASMSELDELEKWIQNSDNEQLFRAYIKINYAIEFNMRKFDSNNVKIELLQEMVNEKKAIKLKRARKVIYYLSAAVVVGILAAIYFYKPSLTSNSLEPIQVIVNNNIEPGTDKAILTLEDGSVVELGKSNSYNTHNINSDGEQIVYKDAKPHQAEIKYNYLTIPRGGQFYVKLSDGTQVWLNSESQLKYPISFIENKTREVELVYGEAYFDVSPSTEHKGSKFMVLNKSQEIEVLGTEFNIKAYKDETNIYTTLVEGKVLVNSPAQSQVLKPKQQTNLNLEDNSMSVATVNVYNEISWKEGVFSFKGKPLKQIMKTISRWYDVDVVFENKELENITFKGVLGKNQELEEILKSIKTLSVLENYEINKETIILK